MGWEELGHVIKDLSQYIGWITVIIGAIIAINKKCRQKIKDVIIRNSNTNEITKDIEVIKNDMDKIIKKKEKSDIAVMALLRNEITGIYYKNLESKKLKSYEKENMTRLYDAYTGLGGNSYIKTLVDDEMKHWSTAP